MRTNWTVYTIVSLTWTYDGTIYRPNESMELPKIATQTRVQLADGSKAYVTPSVLYLNDQITFIWFYDDGTTKTKIEGYVTNQTDLKIIDHNEDEYIGRFTSIESALQIGMTDTYDIQAVFERMVDVGSSSSCSSSSSSSNSSSSSSNSSSSSSRSSSSSSSSKSSSSSSSSSSSNSSSSSSSSSSSISSSSSSNSSSSSSSSSSRSSSSSLSSSA